MTSICKTYTRFSGWTKSSI